MKLEALKTNDYLALSSMVVLCITGIWGVESVLMQVFAALFLAIGISSSVHHAEVIAEKIGPSLGTLVLALAVTVIEVALIVSLMNSGSQAASTIARDTVFSAIMIVTNGIIGGCILIGGLKHKELGFQTMGTSALMSVLAVLSAITLVLPNFTTSVDGPFYSQGQLIFVSVAAILLYGLLVLAQTRSLKSYFEPMTTSLKSEDQKPAHIPTNTRAWFSFVGLLISLIAVVGLAKMLSPSIEVAMTAIGAPKTMVGIVVALLVLAPETFAALNAAKTNQLQTSLNLALGSGAASIALTIPVVSIYSILANQKITLGLDNKSLLFLALTFIVSSFTFGAGRSTALHGIVHLMIMIAYLALSFMP